MCTTYIFGTLLTANGKLKILNILAGTGVAINVILNLILIPKYGVHGAAVSNISTQVYMAVTQIVLSAKIFKFKINYKLIGILLIFIAFLILSGYFIRTLSISWIFGFALVISIGVISGFLTRLLNIKTLYQIIKYN